MALHSNSPKVKVKEIYEQNNCEIKLSTFILFFKKWENYEQTFVKGKSYATTVLSVLRILICMGLIEKKIMESINYVLLANNAVIILTYIVL